MSNNDFSAALEEIASRYHLSPPGDIRIENLLQKYELSWILSVIAPGSATLELGWGDGLIGSGLAKLGNLTVLEGAHSLVQKARKDLPQSEKVSIVHTLFEDFEAENQFDAVVASHVLEHVTDPKLLLQKISSWLKDDGRLIVIVPNKESIHRRLARDIGLISSLEELGERDHMVGHLRVYSRSELNYSLADCGFKVEATRGFFLKPLPNSMMLNWPSNLIEALNAASDSLEPELCSTLGLVASKEKAQ